MRSDGLRQCNAVDSHQSQATSTSLLQQKADACMMPAMRESRSVIQQIVAAQGEHSVWDQYSLPFTILPIRQHWLRAYRYHSSCMLDSTPITLSFVSRKSLKESYTQVWKWRPISTSHFTRFRDKNESPDCRNLLQHCSCSHLRRRLQLFQFLQSQYTTRF